MNELKPNPIFRLMPSLTDVAFLMPIVFLFTRLDGMRTLLFDGDTGWHIRTGEWILANGRVPDQDIFSFTRAGQPWFAWEWLWDICFAWMHRHGGLAAVGLASMLVICLTFALLYRLVNRACGNPLVAIGLALVAACGATLHWLSRPHLFTMLFTVLLLGVLARVREGRTRLLWSLPALTVLWTNLHGGWVVGVLILAAFSAGEAARALVAAGGEERREAWRASMRYLATAAGCLAASLVNPYFYHLHVHIWEYVRNPYAMKYISEFQAANFQNANAIYFEAMLALGAGAAIWHGLHRRFTEVFLLAGWAHLGLIAARNIPLFMIVAAPLVAPAVVAWLAALSEAPVAAWIKKAAGLVPAAGEEIASIDRLWRVHAVSAAAFAVIVLIVTSPVATEKFKPDYDPKWFPMGAMAALDASDRVFTRDQWGDYLIYRLWPSGAKVFVDGRSDFYGEKFGQDYIDVLSVKYDWEQTLARYGVDTILLPTDASLASALKESSHWRVVYDDGMAIVFRPARGAAGRAVPPATTSAAQESGHRA
jgi:hypothetical protein